MPGESTTLDSSCQSTHFLFLSDRNPTTQMPPFHSDLKQYFLIGLLSLQPLKRMTYFTEIYEYDRYICLETFNDHHQI